jgi:ADP-ribosylglycohydrolase
VIGAIVGDILGSWYENDSRKTKHFEFLNPWSRFTDDSVMTIAVGYAIDQGIGYAEAMRKFGIEYPSCGYGGKFSEWLFNPVMGPYGSGGNGSAMRVSPVAWAFETEEAVLREARAQAVVSHNSEEGIRGAQAIALAIFLARNGSDKKEIARRVAAQSGYDLARSLDSIRPTYRPQEACEKSVPEAIIAFLEARGFDDAIRNAISLGGDADTQAAIAGSIAEPFYRGVPIPTLGFALSRLSPWLFKHATHFVRRYYRGSQWPNRGFFLAQFSQIFFLARDYGSFSASRIPEVSDAMELSFTGPAISERGSETKRAIAALIAAGWNRLLIDASRLKRLDESDISELDFYANSVRSRLGAIAIIGLDPTPAFEISETAKRLKILVTDSRDKALTFLDLSRGKGNYLKIK